MATYTRRPVAAPRVSGVALRAFVSALESGALGSTLLGKVTRDSGLDDFRRTPAPHSSPIQVPLPLDLRAPPIRPPSELAAEVIAAPQVSKGARLQTVAAFGEAYRSGKTDPVQVVRMLHQHIERLDHGPDRMAFFIARKPDEVLMAAERSAERLKKGVALSPFDGVPVVVKDEVDFEGFPTTLGTSFMNTPAVKDSTVVARLKAAGAVILGKTNMNEIGINPIGINPHHGACRNPYDRSRICGGSSSGSAAVVAAGIVPMAIGLDGGGSVRIPASLCGVVGLKATFGRISEAGVPPLCWTPGHLGPIGLTVADVAAAYAMIAGPDEADQVSQRQSNVHVSDFTQSSLKGIRLGVCRPYFEDADASVVSRCQDALRILTQAGATIVELPAPDLNTLLWSHAVIILSEMSAAMLPHTTEDASRFGYDTRTNLAIGRHFRATDYVHAMRHRHLITRDWLAQMQTVDAVVTPTCGITAPPIPESALPDGESNLPVVDALLRYVRQGNVTGFPAISIPAGYDGGGLPVGVQLMARPYEEHLLLRLGRVIEASVDHRAPKVHVQVL
jgi:Asp-tRNA(Asn)/Glu-tRNA(Gln) amidotransferase A subunit family amidase